MPDVCERFPEPVRTALHTTLTQAEERARQVREQVERQIEDFGELLDRGKGAIQELAARHPFQLIRKARQPDPVVTEMLRQAQQQRQQLHETARRYLPQGEMEVIQFEPTWKPDFVEYVQARRG
jgi:hypothetical protein